MKENKKIIVLTVRNGDALRKAQALLSESNIEIIATMLEGNFSLLFVNSSSESFDSYSFITKAEEVSIDWGQQWQNHSKGYGDDGLVRFKVASKEILLLPGPGFGDASHPTTQLLLEIIPSLVKGRNVIDIGCGSGVLSIAAAAAGASQVFGIDIDKEAITHAEQNRELNNCKDVSFASGYKKYLLKEPLVLINMISSEQEKAWESLKKACIQPESWAASGLCSDELGDYAARVYRTWGLTLQETQEKEGWGALVFKRT